MAESPSIGHNSNGANDRLRQFARRIERLEEDKAALTADIREVYNEAKSAGYDAKVLRKAIKEAGRDAAEREEEEALLALYVGVIMDTPRGGVNER